jgi:hypothetical protein
MISRMATLAVAGALTSVALPIAGASAGTNGQQLKVCTDEGTRQFSVTGHNQRWEMSTYTHDTWSVGGGCSVTWKWWWKSTVDIYTAGDDGVWHHFQSCHVPEKSKYDIYECGDNIDLDLSPIW